MCDTVDWRNGCWKYKTGILNCNNNNVINNSITVFTLFQINAVLMSIRYFSGTLTKNLTKMFNFSVSLCDEYIKLFMIFIG